MNKKILLTAGGTGGHFFPAVALAEELNSYKNLEAHLVTDNRCKKYLTAEIKIKSHIVDLYINLTGIINKLKLPLLLLKAVIEAFTLVRKVKPSLIIGFGGYPSFPVMLVGQLLSIPTVIYEQNCFFGKSNGVFTKRASLIALAYENTQNLPKQYLTKTIVTGDLVRNEIKNLPQRRNFDHIIDFNLLVIGGSQGAKIFSILIPAAIKILLTKHPEISINITQQVQKTDQEIVRKLYDELKINYVVSDFFHDIYKHYQNCHLVIARSGATTIAELTQIGIPAIFIPLPSAADNHQYYNAKALQDAGASWVYRQKDLTAGLLANKLYDLMTDSSVLQKASLNLLKRNIDGTRNLAATVLKIIT